jgi:hypothetical protein
MPSGGTSGSTSKKTGEPGWKWRRSVVFPLILFACWRLQVMENAPDTMVNQTIAWGWVILIISLAFFYTGFATAQDIAAIIATKSGLPYQQQMQPDPPGRVGDDIPSPEEPGDKPPPGYAG